MKWVWWFLLGAANGVLVAVIPVWFITHNPQVWLHAIAAYFVSGGAWASLAPNKPEARLPWRDAALVYGAVILLWPVIIPLAYMSRERG